MAKKEELKKEAVEVEAPAVEKKPAPAEKKAKDAPIGHPTRAFRQ